MWGFFGKDSGAMTQTPECGVCGGTVAPDGHCWDCGAAQPAFRSHVEITADDGAAGVSDRGAQRGINADAMALTLADGWTIGVVCDGVSLSPRSERAAQVAAEVGAVSVAARLRTGNLPEVALTRAAVDAAHAVTALASSADAAPACTYVAGIACRRASGAPGSATVERTGFRTRDPGWR